jgi:hypothetical protein
MHAVTPATRLRRAVKVGPGLAALQIENVQRHRIQRRSDHRRHFQNSDCPDRPCGSGDRARVFLAQRFHRRNAGEVRGDKALIADEDSAAHLVRPDYSGVGAEMPKLVGPINHTLKAPTFDRGQGLRSVIMAPLRSRPECASSLYGGCPMTPGIVHGRCPHHRSRRCRSQHHSGRGTLNTGALNPNLHIAFNIFSRRL